MNTFKDVQSKLKEGKAFYNFNLPDTTGKRYQLTDFKGKIVILDLMVVFACKGIAPSIEKAEGLFKDKDVQFLSIGIDKKAAKKGSFYLFLKKKNRSNPGNTQERSWLLQKKKPYLIFNVLIRPLSCLR